MQQLRAQWSILFYLQYLDYKKNIPSLYSSLMLIEILPMNSKSSFQRMYLNRIKTDARSGSESLGLEFETLIQT